MSRLFIISILILLSCTTCTKEVEYHDEMGSSREKVPSSLISKIKLWHEGKIINQISLSEQLNISDERDFRSGNKQLLIPDYSNVSYETLPNGATVIEV